MKLLHMGLKVLLGMELPRASKGAVPSPPVFSLHVLDPLRSSRIEVIWNGAVTD
jgi:hypothetical protein